MNGTITPWVSAGSNHEGAGETWTAHVICPSGAAADEDAAQGPSASSAASTIDPVRVMPSSPVHIAILRRRGRRVKQPNFEAVVVWQLPPAHRLVYASPRRESTCSWTQRSRACST